MADLFANLKAVLETTPRRWDHLTQTFPDDLLRRRPLPGEWSALECLLHLIDTERHVFAPRVRALLAGQDFPAFFTDQQGSTLTDDVSATTLAVEFASLRAESLKLVETITSSDLDKTATHSELGRVSLRHLLHEWGGHDLMHLVQAEQALMQPFITGCGPWDVYFTDHVAPAKTTPRRQNVSSGVAYEDIAGYSRAVRVDNMVYVSGTTATGADGEVVGTDSYAQSIYIFQKIERALQQAGATLADVVRTRIYITDPDDWEGPSRAHAEFFGAVRPANTLIAGLHMVGDGYLVEIEAEAIMGASS